MSSKTIPLLLVFVWMLSACSPAAPATEAVAAVTEAPSQPPPTPIERQAQGEMLVFSVGIAVFTVPNPDGRWEVRDLQGDRLVPADEAQAYNIRMSALRDVEDFEARVATLAGDAAVEFAQAGGRNYAIVQRASGPEYIVDADGTVIIATFAIPEGSTVTAPVRDAALDAALNTTVNFID